MTLTDNYAEVRINLTPINLVTLVVEIEGTTSLIVNKFSEKAKQQIKDKQALKAQANRKKVKREPETEFNQARHKFTNEEGKQVDGFPAIGLKAAMIDAGYTYMSLVKKELRGDMHINPDLVEIIAGEPEMREDMVRLAGIGRPADLRYRPEYHPWKMLVPVTFKPDRISPEQVVNMLSHAGFSVGVGEWRPATNGNHGRFHTVNAWSPDIPVVKAEHAPPGAVEGQDFTPSG